MTRRAEAFAVAVALVLSGALGATGHWWFRGRRRVEPAAQVPATGVTAEDRDHDGRPDRWVERDARGAITLVREDQNRDGRADRMSVYVSGRPNRVDYDADFDGRFDHTDDLGADGRVLFTRADADWNTVPERWVQFNAQGRETGEWVDPDQDTIPDRYRAFDARGRVTEEGVDANGDGLYEVNRIYNQRWPDGSPPVRIERDDDRDGVYERRETYTLDGRLKAVQLDTDGDGTRDRMTLFDPAGRVIKDGSDADGDGYFELWRYPQSDGSVRVAHDDDGDQDTDYWDPPGAPAGWCARRCVTRGH